MKKFLFLIAMMFIAVTIFAQPPQKFSYQAIVRDASNNLVLNNTVGVQITILQGDANGTAVYAETHSATTNVNGLMTLQIGDGTIVNGSLANINWAEGPFFLKIETDPNGGTNYTMEGTQQLLSVPYALYAGNSANSFSGDYNDLKNKPTIPSVPTNVSDFTNDASYVNNATCNNISFCDMVNKLTALQNTVDSLIQVYARYNPPMEDTCTPTSSTHNIEIYTYQLPYVFGDTTFLAGTETGTYILKRTNVGGCDSTITINLTMLKFNCGLDTFTDCDNNTYNTVIIGVQCWMKENLKTTKYADGTPIENGSSSSQEVPYWYYPYNDEANKATYGLLYNWKAVMRNEESSSSKPSNVQGVCPTDWHVPSDAEWKELELFAGMSSSCINNTEYRGDIATVIASSSGWKLSSKSNVPGNDSSFRLDQIGFKALPAGCYPDNMNNFDEFAYFWSSTERDRFCAYYRNLSYEEEGVARNFQSKTTACSVRCVYNEDLMF